VALVTLAPDKIGSAWAAHEPKGGAGVSNLTAARAQMGTSLAFHIVFAVLGMGLPLLLVIAEGLWLRSGNPVYLALAKRWSKGLAILFAVGAVSGTILSFELGLLWPRFMQFAGGIIGMPFSAEGFAFFLEAIFIGLYLYGWDRLSPRAHWLCGLPIAVSGAASAIFVVSANAWMNSPAGFRIVDGKVVDVDPVAAMLNGAWFQQALHMTLAAYLATGFGVAGLYAIGMLRGRNDAYHRAGLTIAMALGAIIAPLQAISGDVSAEWVAHHQPAKLAALEGQFETTSGASLSIGGWPDPEARETRYALALPDLLSLLAFHDPHATVRGLDEWPLADQPDPRPVHLAFQLMVGIGLGFIALGATFWWFVRRRRGRPLPRRLLQVIALATPLGFVAIEAGWTVTEMGRQPWIVYGVMRTSEAVTEVPGQFAAFGGFTATYVVLAITTAWLLVRVGRTSPVDPEHEPSIPPSPRVEEPGRVAV
jgi:cytochrome d ubiquinol oxidase subunit I